jgi:hypothetical protein
MSLPFVQCKFMACMPFAMSLPRSKGWAPEVSRLDQAKEGFPYGSPQHARAECSMETLHHSQKDL